MSEKFSGGTKNSKQMILTPKNTILKTHKPIKHTALKKITIAQCMVLEKKMSIYM